jgi:type II secretion system protein G
MKKGFTLIELLVVISIIAMLSSIVLSSVSSAKSKANDATIIQNVKQFKTALEMYRNDYGVYPGTVADESGYYIPNPFDNGLFKKYINANSFPTGIIAYVTDNRYNNQLYGLHIKVNDYSKYNAKANGSCLICGGSAEGVQCASNGWWSLGSNVCTFN